MAVIANRRNEYRRVYGDAEHNQDRAAWHLVLFNPVVSRLRVSGYCFDATKRETQEHQVPNLTSSQGQQSSAWALQRLISSRLHKSQSWVPLLYKLHVSQRLMCLQDLKLQPQLLQVTSWYKKLHLLIHIADAAGARLLSGLRSVVCTQFVKWQLSKVALVHVSS